MNSKKFAKNLIDFIYNSPTAFHAVSTSKELLDANGFIEFIITLYRGTLYQWK